MPSLLHGVRTRAMDAIEARLPELAEFGHDPFKDAMKFHIGGRLGQLAVGTVSIVTQAVDGGIGIIGGILSAVPCFGQHSTLNHRSSRQLKEIGGLLEDTYRTAMGVLFPWLHANRASRSLGGILMIQRKCLHKARKRLDDGNGLKSRAWCVAGIGASIVSGIISIPLIAVLGAASIVTGGTLGNGQAYTDATCSLLHRLGMLPRDLHRFGLGIINPEKNIAKP